WIGRGADQLGLEQDVAARPALGIGCRLEPDDQLPAANETAHHPIERALADDLIGAFGHHAGPVDVEPVGASQPLGAALSAPFGQFLDRRNAHAQLDDMHIDPKKKNGATVSGHPIMLLDSGPNRKAVSGAGDDRDNETERDQADTCPACGSPAYGLGLATHASSLYCCTCDGGRCPPRSSVTAN